MIHIVFYFIFIFSEFIEFNFVLLFVWLRVLASYDCAERARYRADQEGAHQMDQDPLRRLENRCNSISCCLPFMFKKKRKKK